MVRDGALLSASRREMNSEEKPSARAKAAWRLGNYQMEISKYLTFVEGTWISEPSFLSPTKWYLIAVRIRDRVSFMVGPVATQPGRSGLYAE